MQGRFMMSEQKTVGVGDFLIWLLLCVVTFEIYTLWWTYSRAETVLPGDDRSGT